MSLSLIPEMLIATAIRTIVPKSMERLFLGMMVSITAPMPVPASLPAIAHFISFILIERCSLRDIKVVKPNAAKSIGPGTKTGLIMTRRGTPIRPRPNPIEP